MLSKDRLEREQADLKLKRFQNSCPHISAKWMHYFVFGGLTGPDVLICERCDKVLKTKAREK